MGKRTNKISSRIEQFIKAQKIFFVGTAMSEGTVNVSPKGMDSFRVLSPNRVIWLNLTGSGNETATHLKYLNRMTVMFCAFEGAPMILRLYGKAKTYHDTDAEYRELITLFPSIAGSRQIFDMEVELVQTSCGMAVPFMEFKGHREELADWASEQGEEGIKDYQRRKNVESLDGYPSGIFDS